MPLNTPAPVGAVLGETVLVQVGNGASPEVFTAPALINTTRSLKLSANVETGEIVDTANPQLAAYVTRYVRSVDVTFDGAGTLDATSTGYWFQWLLSGQPKNCKITQTNTGANGGWTLTGSFSLLTFDISADRRKQSDATISLAAAGVVAYTPNA